MDFLEVVKQTRVALQSEGRITYRTLKRQFALDDEALDDLKYELIEGQEVAVDKDGKMLVWRGASPVPGSPFQVQSPPQSPPPNPQPPVSYTPQHLAERILAEQAAMESRGSANGERKTITALFADLKGSTALIEGLDPEDARAIIDPALQLMMDAVHRYDGYVAQALGDGIFALFGAPIAHEDHPQRALYAALRMQEEMRHYSDKLREEGAAPLQMRVGVNTGEVVVRSIRKDDLHADYVPVGHSTNIAARMEQLANPGSILVTEQTYKLTGGYFAFTALGKTKVKGIEEPVSIYEVTGAGPLRTRLQVSAHRGLSRFVGRHSEMEQMQQALAQARAGHGQIVGVMGEPGLGKSRLFYEFKLISQSGCLVLEAFAVSHGKASPYLPLIELLKDYFEIDPTDEERKRREKITGKVLALDRSLEDTLLYLFSLLGIDDDQSSLQQMDAQMRRRRTFEALKHLFLRESLNQPLLLIFEDLHWIDTETQGFLDTLSDSLASAQLVLLVNYRPEYRHDWGHKTYYSQLRLAPLGQDEADELLTFLLGKEPSLTALKPLILARTEGTPFFMEEVVQTLVEEGALRGERGHYRLEHAPTELHISPTVQGVLAARIDRLAAEEKVLLQQLSVIGRQFPVSLVKHVVSHAEADLYRVLASLQAKEFLYEQPAFPESEYLFKHALTQDVAYGTLLQEQRKALHERTGQAMEALYKEALDEHSNELAYHYSRSENREKAVQYLGLAGQRAVQHFAYRDAATQLRQALDLLQTLPDTVERTRHELNLLTVLGTAVAATSTDITAMEAIYGRARALCEQLGATSELFLVLRGLASIAFQRGHYAKGGEIGRQILALAHDGHDPLVLSQGYHMVAGAEFFLGEFARAWTSAEQGLSYYDPASHQVAARQYTGIDPGVSNSLYRALAPWYLGYPDQAQQKMQEALALARSLYQPANLTSSLGMVLGYAALLHCLRREVKRSQELADMLARHNEAYGFTLFSAIATVIQGRALVERGEGADGLARMRQGLAALQQLGFKLGWTWYQALLVEAYGRASQPEEGLAVLTKAFQSVEESGGHFYEAELHRLKGELLLQQSQDNGSDAETSFHTALEVARQQEAKSWELRAATSLARLWQSQGKTTEARDLLAPVYNWFTEGFDTADLKDAKSLLDELSEGI